MRHTVLIFVSLVGVILISRFIAAIALSPRLHNATDLDAVGWAVDRKPLTWLIVNSCFRNHKCFTCQSRPQYRRTRSEVFPILSRIQNIGCEMGIGEFCHSSAELHLRISLEARLTEFLDFFFVK